MQPEFWHKRWASNQIGFHLPQVNPYLQRFWPALGLEEGSRVLVPLCGKSLDLLWLAHQGHEVLGVELSEKPWRTFSASIT
jgi:thiopurine S-methyltransferase